MFWLLPWGHEERKGGKGGVAQGFGIETSRGTLHFLPNSAQSRLCPRGQWTALFLFLVLGVGLLPGIWTWWREMYRGHWRWGADLGAPLAPLPTSGAVGDNGHSQVHLVGVHVRGGADGIVAGLEQGQLGQEQGRGHLDGWELLQHLHNGGVLAPFPFLVLLQTLCQGDGQRRTCSQLQEQTSKDSLRRSREIKK